MVKNVLTSQIEHIFEDCNFINDTVAEMHD